MNQYEAMFLFDPTFGNSMENCESEVNRLLERAGAELIFLGKWDERRLAYRIDGRKRGVYVLVYFNSPPDKIVGIQRDAQISEEILRLLVIRADEVTREMMERQCATRGADRSGDDGKATARPAEKESSPPPKVDAVVGAATETETESPAADIEKTVDAE